MHVQVDGGLLHAQARQPRFLAGLTLGNRGQITITVGMAAGLEPTVQLHVMEDKGRRSARVNDRSGTGEMARQTRSVQCVGVLPAEFQYLVAVLLLLSSHQLRRTNLRNCQFKRSGQGGFGHLATLVIRAPRGTDDWGRMTGGRISGDGSLGLALLVTTEVDRSFGSEAYGIEAGLGAHRSGEKCPSIGVLQRREGGGRFPLCRPHASGDPARHLRKLAWVPIGDSPAEPDGPGEPKECPEYPSRRNAS